MKLILEKMYEGYSCKKIYLSIHEDNYNAIRLYKKLGFKKTLFKDPKGERIMTHTNQDRVLFDDFGCLTTLPSDFSKRLREH